jgi:hypothetical protein
MIMQRLILVCAFLVLVAAREGAFPAHITVVQGEAEPPRCRALYQSYTRCYETGRRVAYEACVAVAHQTSEELLGRLGQNPPQESAVRALESACLLGCETAQANTFLASGDFARAMCP